MLKMADILESKIQSLLMKKLQLEERSLLLDANKTLGLDKSSKVSQTELEKKVVLRELCGVKIRLSNLKREKAKDKAVVESILKFEYRNNSSNLDDIEVCEDTETQVPDSDDDSLEDSFHTACDTIVDDQDLIIDLDEENNEMIEVEAEEQSSPVISLLPVLQLQKSKLIHGQQRQGKEEDMNSVYDSQYESEEDGLATSTPKPRTLFEENLAIWVRENKSQIIQRVRELTKNCPNTELLDKSPPTLVMEKKHDTVIQEPSISDIINLQEPSISDIITLQESVSSVKPGKEVPHKRVSKSTQ